MIEYILPQKDRMLHSAGKTDMLAEVILLLKELWETAPIKQQ